MEGRERVLAEGSAQRHSQMLKKAHSKAQQCHLLSGQGTWVREEVLRRESITKSLSMNAHIFIGGYFINYQEKDVQKDNALHWAEAWSMLPLLSLWK